MNLKRKENEEEGFINSDIRQLQECIDYGNNNKVIINTLGLENLREKKDQGLLSLFKS